MGEKQHVSLMRRRTIRISKTDRQRMSNYFTEYCNSTSIHGFRYLGEQRRSCFEKIWWIITIAISVFGCVLLILKAYEKWHYSPVIVSFATTQTPIWDIPFPAVTICPETKFRRTFFNFTDSIHKYVNNNEALSPDEMKNLIYSSLICKARNEMKGDYNTVDNEIVDFFRDAAPQFHNVSLECKWMDTKIVNCEEFFNPILTDVGICHTFNMHKWDELFTPSFNQTSDFLKHDKNSTWVLEKGYDIYANVSTYPQRATYSGISSGLEITLVSYTTDLDYICTDSHQGYKIILHHPAQFPRPSKQYFRLPLDQTILAAIKPQMMTAADALIKSSIADRKCYFSGEKVLAYFQTYTQENCEIELITNETLKNCGCVAYHMPRMDGVLICGPSNTSCIKEAEVSLLGELISKVLKDKQNDEQEKHDQMTGYKYYVAMFQNIFGRGKTDETKRSFICLPACTSLKFNAETSQTDWDWTTQMKDLNDPYSFLKQNSNNRTRMAHLSKLVLFFKDIQFIASERNELYGLTDFISNCGGLLGLFTGFSVISLVEIIYFITFRWFCNIRLLGKKHWAGLKF